MSLGCLGDGRPFWEYCQCECQKHIVNMVLFTGFDILGIRIKKCHNIIFYFSLRYFDFFFPPLSTLGLIPVSMENLQNFITKVII